jgi:Subtilase family
MSTPAEQPTRTLPARPPPRARPGSRGQRPRWLTAATALLLAVTPATILPAAAHAETAVTAQATADNGAFLPYAPAPAQPGGLCLVDTGVDLNPDTEGVVVDRTAIDGGSGEDVSPTMHGTVLAMMAAASANGWGMVGTAPRSVRIVSVRILEPGQTTFPFSAYAAGITACLRIRTQYDIKVINLSLGSPDTPSSSDYKATGNAIERAINYGVAVVASAGNDNGQPLEYPAAYPAVLSVGASDTQGGAFCPFSNRGEGLRLLAPGCDLNGADPASGTENYNYFQGSSESSAITAAGLTALESYDPGLPPQAAEEYLTGAHGGVLDIAQAFRNASLGQIVAEGEAAEPGAQAPQNPGRLIPPPGVTPSGTMTPTIPFPRPRAQLKRVHGRPVLVLSGRPGEAQAQVRCLGHRGRSRRLSVLRTLSGRSDDFTIPASAVEVSVRYTDPYALERDGPWTTLPVRRAPWKTGKTRHTR